MFTIDMPKTDEDYTTSRMKMWFMVQLQGYTVVEEIQVPKVTPQGRLTYECRWYLRPPS